MQLKEDKIGGILVLKPLDKRFDAHSAVDFKARMADSALKTVGRNGDLVLCGIKETVMSLFRLTRMDRVFRIFTDQGEATAALSS
jgi:anti-sigma B factor antagonist